MNRKQIEELILLLNPCADVHMFKDNELPVLLKHEVLHAVHQSAGGVRRTLNMSDDEREAAIAALVNAN